jgi:hypothetical protein
MIKNTLLTEKHKAPGSGLVPAVLETLTIVPLDFFKKGIQMLIN